jgi:hypothetical protein
MESPEVPSLFPMGEVTEEDIFDLPQ